MQITALKLKRQEKGITQEMLAKKTAIPVRTYQRYESGERIPDVHTAMRLAKELDTTIEDLFETPQRQLRGASPSKIKSNEIVT